MNLLQLLATGAPPPPTYVEDVFSAYTYAGNGSTQSIVNGVDLSGKGGMVWCKCRNFAQHNQLMDTVNGTSTFLVSNLTAANTATNAQITSFNSNGFTMGADTGYKTCNSTSGQAYTYVGWSFAKAAKFFDVVTYTGTGANRTISHSLGQVPGMIVVKATSAAGYGWAVYHRSIANTEFLRLDLTQAVSTSVAYWNSTTATSTEFSVGVGSLTNDLGISYVAYLFAHDDSATGLIQCGSAAMDTNVSLGWEPQFILFKRTDDASLDWYIFDTARGFFNSTVAGSDNTLNPNLSGAESSGQFGQPTATGFLIKNIGLSGTYIYLAIRRGPMALPTAGTQVYNAIARTGTGAAATITGVGFPPDAVFAKGRYWAADDHVTFDRLRGAGAYIGVSSTGAEAAGSDSLLSFDMDGVSLGIDTTTSRINKARTAPTEVFINWFFRRYPGVFDEVCYTGTGTTGTKTHNLGVVPELIIIKNRSFAVGGGWPVYAAPMGNTNAIWLNTTSALSAYAYWNNTSPTSSVFIVNTDADINSASYTYVAYLFASLAGISKVGTYTGNGTNQTINCGFAAGARFVLVKATSTTGNWIVGDSTRGLVAGNDPYLLLNTTGAEVTGEDWLDPDNSGFVVNETTAAANTNGVTYIYLAFA